MDSQLGCIIFRHDDILGGLDDYLASLIETEPFILNWAELLGFRGLVVRWVVEYMVAGLFVLEFQEDLRVSDNCRGQLRGFGALRAG